MKTISYKQETGHGKDLYPRGPHRFLLCLIPRICLCTGCPFCFLNNPSLLHLPISMSNFPGQTQISPHPLSVGMTFSSAISLSIENQNCLPLHNAQRLKLKLPPPPTQLTVCIRGWQTFSPKGQINIVGFAGNIRSVLHILFLFPFL